MGRNSRLNLTKFFSESINKRTLNGDDFDTEQEAPPSRPTIQRPESAIDSAEEALSSLRPRDPTESSAQELPVEETELFSGTPELGKRRQLERTASNKRKKNRARLRKFNLNEQDDVLSILGN
jgi:hypothetical protein